MLVLRSFQSSTDFFGSSPNRLRKPRNPGLWFDDVLDLPEELYARAKSLCLRRLRHTPIYTNGDLAPGLRIP